MYSYLIDPLAPLVFRSGKPFGSVASAQDVVFPLPSAVAGLVRALSIQQGHIEGVTGRLSESDASHKAVLQTSAQGPFLVKLSDDTTTAPIVLLPKPANALYFDEEKADQDSGTDAIKIVAAVPNSLANGVGCDLPDGLLPVQLTKPISQKPKSGVAYWAADDIIKWLAGDALDYKTIKQRGETQLPIDIRTHVAIDSETLAHRHGALFQTASFDFAPKVNKQDGKTTFASHRFGFAVMTEQDLQDDMAAFGGERRLSRFTRQAIALTAPDTDLLTQINTNKGFAVYFATPAIFAQGYLPAWLDELSKTGKLFETGASVTLKACAIDRWQTVSGWDSVLWKPKATRKAVSAGSVYWFALNADLTQADLERMTTSVWSDHTQDQHDGFGTALIAAWQPPQKPSE